MIFPIYSRKANFVMRKKFSKKSSDATCYMSKLALEHKIRLLYAFLTTGSGWCKGIPFKKSQQKSHEFTSTLLKKKSIAREYSIFRFGISVANCIYVPVLAEKTHRKVCQNFRSVKGSKIFQSLFVTFRHISQICSDPFVCFDPLDL